MTGSVIVRGETTIVDQLIYHDDRAITWDEADALAGKRLDRRKALAFVQGELCIRTSWTQSCSGCAEWAQRGLGCHECGHHGVVRQSMWVPT